jgi:hypothetical protein
VPTGHNPNLLGQFLIIVAQHLMKVENHDFRAPIFRVGREMATNRGISILSSITTNHHDLRRAVLLAPLLNQINCVREPPDEEMR